MVSDATIEPMLTSDYCTAMHELGQLLWDCQVNLPLRPLRQLPTRLANEYVERELVAQVAEYNEVVGQRIVQLLSVIVPLVSTSMVQHDRAMLDGFTSAVQPLLTQLDDIVSHPPSRHAERDISAEAYHDHVDKMLRVILRLNGHIDALVAILRQLDPPWYFRFWHHLDPGNQYYQRFPAIGLPDPDWGKD